MVRKSFNRGLAV